MFFNDKMYFLSIFKINLLVFICMNKKIFAHLLNQKVTIIMKLQFNVYKMCYAISDKTVGVFFA